MKIKRLGVDDVALAESVVKRFKRQTVSPEYLQRFLGDSRNVLYVAEIGGKAEGFLLAYRLDRIDGLPPKVFVYEVDVLEESRRRGIGTQLMDAVRDMIRQEELTNAFVLTNYENEGAVAFYEATGGKVPHGDDVMFVYHA